jgi:uncharacterized membrane protein required for colicin V production
VSGVVVDIAVAAFLGHAIWRGWSRGFVRGVAKLLGLLVAAVAAALLHGPVAALLGAFGVPERYDDLAAALVVFAGVLIGFRFAGDAIARLLRATKIGGLADRGAGAALSGIWALALTALVLLGISLFEGSAAARAVGDSTLGSSIVESAPEVAEGIADADLRGWLFEILRPSD